MKTIFKIIPWLLDHENIIMPQPIPFRCGRKRPFDDEPGSPFDCPDCDGWGFNQYNMEPCLKCDRTGTIQFVTLNPGATFSLRQCLKLNPQFLA